MNKEWRSSTKIILGIDIGTTYSAASFAYLIEGQVPKITRVTKWPGQRGGGQQCSIPSWIWYDAQGEPVKIGAEAADDEIADDGPEKGWTLVKYFKLHLHPPHMAPPGGFKLDALPRQAEVSRIYFHFLRYMFGYVKEFFEKETVNGPEVWKKYASSMDIVITHPNGWGIHEQQKLRTAAIQAGLTSTGQSASQIMFLSEGEASIHFCIHSALSHSPVSRESKIMVCDAGGSTVDTTVYNVTSTGSKLELEEIKSSACVQAGSIFVDAAASKYIRSSLERIGLPTAEIESHTKQGSDAFTRMIKPEYTGDNDVMGCKIGEKTFNKPSINIINGRMRLSGTTLKSFFDPCIDQIVRSAQSQAENITSPYIFLVGGFGDSPYLQKTMTTRLGASSKLTTSNEPGAKAVADGAVIWAISQNVVSRAARYAYGVSVAVRYDSSKPEHARRECVIDSEGERVIPGGWSQIIAKDKVMSTDSSVGMPYYRPYSVPWPTLSNFSTLLYSTTQPASTEFMKDRDGSIASGFYPVCTISADIHELEGHLTKKTNAAVGLYWELHFRVCIKFGDTELKAYIEWMDKEGVIRKGEATTIAASVA